MIEEGDETLLLLTRAALKRVFPDWNAVRSEAKRHMLPSSEKHLAAKRKVRSNERSDRVYVFMVN